MRVVKIKEILKDILKYIRNTKKFKNFLKFYKIYFIYLQKKVISKGNYILKIKDYFSKNLDVINYTVLNPSYQIDFSPEEIKYLNENIICEKNISKLKFQKEIFTCIFKNVKFFGMSGGISYKNKVIVESVFDETRYRKSMNIDSFFLKHRRLNGISTSIMNLDWSKINIFHWIIECLPRLYGISLLEEPKINFIINKDIGKKQLRMLKFFLDDRFTIIPISSNEVWELETYFFSSFITSNCSGYMPLKYLKYIKKKIIEGYGIKEIKGNKRIYISRNKALRRRLKNEKQFFELLKDYNFKRVYAEDLPFKEQVKLFNSANIVISTTGAGLTNIIFSDNLKIIVLYPPKLLGTHFLMLSKALGFTYRYIIGYDQDAKGNFRVDLSRTEEIIKDLIRE